MINKNNATETDIHYMKLAIALGEQGRVTAPPNPWVGSLIVQSNTIIGEGYHRAAGEPHAEIIALQNAQSKLTNLNLNLNLNLNPSSSLPSLTTLYVTLEPCSHHGRTPPCAEALINSGITRVVIGIQDPDPRVSGRGIELLKKNGIEVVTGVCRDEVEQSLRPYLHHRRTGLPYCLAKVAMSLDGRTAAADGSSQWITSTEARLDAHQLRAESQAIMIGANTAIKDSPQLTVRDVKVQPTHKPLRVVIDPQGKLKPPSPLLDEKMAPTLIFTYQNSFKNTKQNECENKANGVEFIYFTENEIHLIDVLKELGKRGIIQVMIEGGATLLGRAVKEGVIDQYVIYVGSKIIGDQGLSLFKGLPMTNIDQAIDLKLINVRQLGTDVRLDYLSIIH